MYDKTTLHAEDRPSGLKVIRIQGDLDSMGTHMVSDALAATLDRHSGNALIDLSKVGFISSAGMAMLLVKGKNLRRAGGRLAIAGASPRVLEVLSLAGFHELFDVYPTPDEAIAALEAA